MDLSLSELIAAFVAGNLMTLMFVAGCVYAYRNPGFKQPFYIWAAMMLPLLFVLGAYITTGDLPRRSGG